MNVQSTISRFEHMNALHSSNSTEISPRSSSSSNKGGVPTDHLNRSKLVSGPGSSDPDYQTTTPSTNITNGIRVGKNNLLASTANTTMTTTAINRNALTHNRRAAAAASATAASTATTTTSTPANASASSTTVSNNTTPSVTTVANQNRRNRLQQQTLKRPAVTSKTAVPAAATNSSKNDASGASSNAANATHLNRSVFNGSKPLVRKLNMNDQAAVDINRNSSTADTAFRLNKPMISHVGTNIKNIQQQLHQQQQQPTYPETNSVDSGKDSFTASTTTTSSSQNSGNRSLYIRPTPQLSRTAQRGNPTSTVKPTPDASSSTTRSSVATQLQKQISSNHNNSINPNDSTIKHPNSLTTIQSHSSSSHDTENRPTMLRSSSSASIGRSSSPFRPTRKISPSDVQSKVSSPIPIAQSHDTKNVMQQNFRNAATDAAGHHRPLFPPTSTETTAPINTNTTSCSQTLSPTSFPSTADDALNPNIYQPPNLDTPNLTATPGINSVKIPRQIASPDEETRSTVSSTTSSGPLSPSKSRRSLIANKALFQAGLARRRNLTSNNRSPSGTGANDSSDNEKFSNLPRGIDLQERSTYADSQNTNTINNLEYVSMGMMHSPQNVSSWENNSTSYPQPMPLGEKDTFNTIQEQHVSQQAQNPIHLQKAHNYLHQQHQATSNHDNTYHIDPISDVDFLPDRSFSPNRAQQQPQQQYAQRYPSPQHMMVDTIKVQEKMNTAQMVGQNSNRALSPLPPPSGSRHVMPGGRQVIPVSPTIPSSQVPSQQQRSPQFSRKQQPPPANSSISIQQTQQKSPLPVRSNVPLSPPVVRVSASLSPAGMPSINRRPTPGYSPNESSGIGLGGGASTQTGMSYHDDEITLTSVRQIVGNADSTKSPSSGNIGVGRTGSNVYGENNGFVHSSSTTSESMAQTSPLSLRMRPNQYNRDKFENSKARRIRVSRSSSSDYMTDADESADGRHSTLFGENVLKDPNLSALSTSQLSPGQARYYDHHDATKRKTKSKSIPKDDETFDYGDNDDDDDDDDGRIDVLDDDDNSQGSLSYAQRREKAQRERAARKAAAAAAKAELDGPFLKTDDLNHYRKALDTPLARTALVVAGAATLGSVAFGAVGILVGAAAVGIGVGYMQIPDEQRQNMNNKATEAIRNAQESAFQASEKMSNSCATTYQYSGLAEHVPNEITTCCSGLVAGIDKSVSTVVEENSVLDNAADNNHTSNFSNTAGDDRYNPSTNGGVKDGSQAHSNTNANSASQAGVRNNNRDLRNNFSPSQSGRFRDNKKGKVACLREGKYTPISEIHSLPPAQQPKAWIEILASIETNYSDKMEAMEEISILAKDKQRARFFLDEGILDSLLWMISRYFEKKDHDALSAPTKWSNPIISRDEAIAVKRAALCCLSLGKSYCAAMHTEGDLLLMSLYERGSVPEERQLAQMLFEVPYHIRTTKTDDPTIIRPKEETFALKQLTLPQAEELSERIKAVATSTSDMP